MTDQEKQQIESEIVDFQVIDKRHFVNLDPIDRESVPEEKPRYPSYVEELMARMTETERKFQEKKKQIDEEINRTKTRLEIDFDRRLRIGKTEDRSSSSRSARQPSARRGFGFAGRKYRAPARRRTMTANLFRLQASVAWDRNDSGFESAV